MYAIVIVLILLLLYLAYLYFFKYSPYNTKLISNFRVHRQHNDQQAAAALLQEITKRNNTLLEHLQSKYLNESIRGEIDPTKNNRIDIVPNSSLYNWTQIDQDKLMKIQESEYIQERIKQLLQRYDADDIHEISPLNKRGVTSYTENKKTLILCLRKKEIDANGENELHDINTMMFVVIHELSHMMNDIWGHKMDFWVLFKFMLENAIEAGIYQPVNYAKYPIVYCGLKLTYNPLYDTSLIDFI